MSVPESQRPSLDDPEAWIPYRYVPSNGAAITFSILFAITTLYHVFQLIKKRTWYFIPMVVGGFLQVFGYICRALNHDDVWSLPPYIIQNLFLLVAPALFAASIYIILGRIILLTDGERYSLVRQKWLTKLFVAGDVLSFFTQSSGGSIQAGGSHDLLLLGEKVIIVGLFIQVAVFGFFMVVAGVFHYHLAIDKPSTRVFPPMSKKTKARLEGQLLSSTEPVDIATLPWKKHIYLLYAASALIMVRSVFRVIEYVQGNNGYLLRHEVYLYVFDAALMLATMVLFNWTHPSEVTDLYSKRMSAERVGNLELSRNSLNREQAEGYEANRGIGYV